MKYWVGFATLLALASGVGAAKWTRNGDYWGSSMGTYSVSVAPKRAGKLVSFQYRKLDVIRPGESDGAFFWPSPQHSWVPTANWPPPQSFTDSTYRVSFSADSLEIRLAGPANDYTKLQVTKRFRFDSTAGALVLTYVTTNTAKDSARHFAPWETSRGYSNSMLFFPKATSFKFANSSGSGLSLDLPLTRDDSLGWFQDDGLQAGLKFFRDGGEGWMAQLKDSLLFVKQYDDVDSSKFGSWESDIEGYAAKGFIENEIQGPWAAIAPGDSMVWTTRWSCTTMAKGANLQVGSPDLKAAARALAKSSTASSRPRHSTFTPNRRRPLVDIRGRLLPKSARSIGSGSVGILPIR